MAFRYGYGHLEQNFAAIQISTEKRARDAYRRAIDPEIHAILYYLEVSIERERQEALARGDLEDAMRATLAKAELRYLAS